MAPVIWGLPLADIKWSAFKNSNMWNNRYHLRRTKFAVYQGAMIFCVVSESLGTDALSNYKDEQKNIQKAYPNANIANNDIIGSFSYNIFAGVFVATIFGAAFFFDLFWPERMESKPVQLAWKICSILSVLFVLASAINLTIIISTHQALLSDPTGSVPQSVLDGLNPVLNYGKNGEAVASVVLIWIGWLFTIWAAYLMITCTSYIEANGPLSTHAKTANSTTPGALEAADGTHDTEGKKSMEELSQI
ncbi:hypothetical protein E2P81_ATG02631 [Venturia nashicola]|uniref:Uncharacterized protein n=1 Tax=Venturia nashicola TaxID=86259 RepID=A0A4Z1PLH0_9PEZI|nr:hypothetical protein E6O75_ATG02695 [Venturia nashicola]TLD36849.1 hypothetical protein E2P81_ATG02631 [Venturia nashicola]